MPIKVAFQNLQGKKYKEVLPDGGLLNILLPLNDGRFPLLGWVDEYSNTIFNSNQMRPLIEELDRLVEDVSSENGKQILTKIRELATECRDSPQTYLRFIGD
jgi:hypothetical protein